jgi:hypothetical protein
MNIKTDHFLALNFKECYINPIKMLVITKMKVWNYLESGLGNVNELLRLVVGTAALVIHGFGIRGFDFLWPKKQRTPNEERKSN